MYDKAHNVDEDNGRQLSSARRPVLYMNNLRYSAQHQEEGEVVAEVQYAHLQEDEAIEGAQEGLYVIGLFMSGAQASLNLGGG